MDGAHRSAIELAARRLQDAAEQGAPCAPIRDIVSGGADTAYAVQEINTSLALSRGRRLVGRKIGLTSPKVQAQLGVNEPDYGMLFDDMRIADGGVVAHRQVLQPRAEAEIAFVLKADLPSANVTVDQVRNAIAFACASIEIVGSRIANWDITLIDTIADNASSGAFVLGNEQRDIRDIDLAACTMRMRRGKEIVSTGDGAACMGNPLNAATWLARVMAERGRPLLAGDVIMSGALGPMVDAKPGDAFVAEIDGFRAVSVSFAKGA